MNPIELDHVTVVRSREQNEGSPILDDLTLSVGDGASLGLVGPNGSGKTTLLRVLACLVRPASGRAMVCGFDTTRDPIAVRRRIGYVPEQFGVYPRLSIVQYLQFFARASGVSQWERRNTVETMLRVVDLFDQRHEEAAALSRGSRRRLALARALLHNPPVLLLDDPLAGLDGRGRLELVEVLREVRDMGITIVVSTHLLADLAQVCDSVAVLRAGRLASITPLAVALGREGRGRQRVRLELIEGVRSTARPEAVGVLLSKQPGVLDVTEGDGGLSFVYEGDPDGLASVLDRLVGSGARVVQFGRGPEQLDELSAALAEGDDMPRAVRSYSA
ncbi:MAG TPA: ABC transporter ATP-binding protein [Chloroflexota bacterium]|nr:ABC transporter ATP-binding protein [Chloroflexota bacterium]